MRTLIVIVVSLALFTVGWMAGGTVAKACFEAEFEAEAVMRGYGRWMPNETRTGPQFQWEEATGAPQQ